MKKRKKVAKKVIRKVSKTKFKSKVKPRKKIRRGKNPYPGGERIKTDKPDEYYKLKLKQISPGSYAKMVEWLHDYYIDVADLDQKEPDWSKGNPLEVIKAIDMIYFTRIDGFVLDHPNTSSPLNKPRLRSYFWDSIRRKNPNWIFLWRGTPTDK